MSCYAAQRGSEPKIIILKSTIHKYRADLERLSGYLSTNTAIHTTTISAI